ncbi:hypothetical protein [Xenorhabdus szentirmaii]|nr:MULTISPECIES: hypothetical protein [unclassified Xenorhabdus]MBD2792409.1 hypothetical protein [Xenorhabdus sp. CUL]MBD2825912.1 hypothetical protein [Xenorhabdus sp. 5]
MQLNNDFDLYRITTISVNNNQYMTDRGIFIGMKVDSVLKVYGKPDEENEEMIQYKFTNKVLSFKFEQEYISGITMEELPI